jgi:hypothetical protein
MAVDNSDMSAHPFVNAHGKLVGGLTKREYACIHCGVPETSDVILDAIIEEGNRIRLAIMLNASNTTETIAIKNSI